jgi:hypothetical protein
MPGASQTFPEEHLRAKCKIDTRSGIWLNTPMETEKSDYFRVIISEDKDFNALKGGILEIIIDSSRSWGETITADPPRRRDGVQ